ncbi:uncharacterized protein LOC121740044 [Aricia agestis]|uniref:uncharacterized protein LOC121740044 n=1 Tax=Aricia agestis TaxID=91739 RepID=UPI001C203703|nr:uncharacterized protein LOC121740044 [Aricia agestis]
MIKEDIAKCHFVPTSSLKKVIQLLDIPVSSYDTRCKRNLVHLQQRKSNYSLEIKKKSWFHLYQIALRRAIYSHDWDRLSILLKKSPIQEHALRTVDDLVLYVRALTILLMNHPSAKTQSLLTDFLHMVLACRSGEDKKAIYKALLTLPEKMYGRSSYK